MVRVLETPVEQYRKKVLRSVEFAEGAVGLQKRVRTLMSLGVV
jgi:hypothetical protein